ncbi:MAG: carboxypeptidase-like regulatory domain-containing protein [Candidatus Acidoferrales bacterium]
MKIGSKSRALGRSLFVLFLPSLMLLFFLAALPRAPEKHISPLVGIKMTGRVLYPDGRPAAGATVTVTTVCEEVTVHLARETKTAEDGSFVLESFDPGCNRIQFTAAKREEYWLETGEDSLYTGTNGTAPTVTLSPGSPPPPITIILGQRGGEVEIQVWDIATKRFIYAGLEFQRRPIEGQTFPFVYISTGEDGASHTVFLPVGEYEIALNYFDCRGKTYFADDLPQERFVVLEGEHRIEQLSVDITQVEVRSSYDNPGGERCKP